MKQTLLLLAVIFSLNATAQKSDYMFIGKPDTLKVIMLVGDTTTQYPHDSMGGATSYKNYSTFMKYGYMVQNVNKPTTYLDDKKKPLLPSIIVWQSKTL